MTVNFVSIFRGAASDLSPEIRGDGADFTTIAPGQLWLIRLPSASWALSAVEAAAVADANVVIYDPELSPLVAGLLPLGGYAESVRRGVAASSGPRTDTDGFDRACRFARDGWSVVRLIVEGASSASAVLGRAEVFAGRLLARGVRNDLPTGLMTDCGLGPILTRTRLGRVAGLLDEIGANKPLTVMFDQLGSGIGPHLYAVASNGLAG